LHGARIEDLGESDFLRVERVACGHNELIPRIGMVVGLRPRASVRGSMLQSRFTRRECELEGQRGALD
jgi:hypothetical protein